MITRKKMQGLIKAGRSAIEYRMLLILVRPRASTQADDAEMEETSALLRKYNALMAEYEEPKPPSISANDENGGKE
ncbi:MAG: hypothetical protein WBM09_11680 [Gallionella sp.]